MSVVLLGMTAVIVPVTFAQGTILPKAGTAADCNSLFNLLAKNGGKIDSSVTDHPEDLLGCGIKTGKITLAMIPFYIQYFSNYLLGMVSMIALLFVVIGGFMYSAGDLVGKDKGKVYIKNALIGMVIAFLAWSIVSVILAAVTG